MVGRVGWHLRRKRDSREIEIITTRLPEAESAIAPSNTSPVVLNCTNASSALTGRSQSTLTRRLTRSARLPFADLCVRGGYIAAGRMR
jgi:hypothetical protein